MLKVRGGVVGMIATVALVFSAAPAQAGVITDGADCGASPPLLQAFLPWADVSNYGLAPDGGLEGGGTGWSLSGGAAVASGNETNYVHALGDHSLLAMPAGSSATTAPTCVGLEYPTIRFFTRASGLRLGSTMLVEVLFDDALTGATRSLPIGVALPSSGWQPTLPMAMLVSTLGALTQNGMVAVEYRFTPVGAASWQLDDLYVDPWRKP